MRRDETRRDDDDDDDNDDDDNDDALCVLCVQVQYLFRRRHTRMRDTKPAALRSKNSKSAAILVQLELQPAD